jgi:hypothetical protein
VAIADLDKDGTLDLAVFEAHPPGCWARTTGILGSWSRAIAAANSRSMLR